MGALESDEEPDDIQARLFHRLALSAGNDPQSLSAFLRRRRSPVRTEDLAAVTCPVLVVLGDRDMGGRADRLVAELPSATLVMLPGVDHFATPVGLRCDRRHHEVLGAGVRRPRHAAS